MKRFGSQYEQPHRDDARAKIAPNGKRGEQAVEAETALVLETAKLSGLVTELAQWFKGGTVNDVLFSGSVAIPAGGVYSGDWSAPFGFVVLANLGTTTMTLVAGGNAESTAPPNGPGVHVVPPGAVVGVLMADRALGIIGTAADRALLQVTAGPRRPFYQLIASGPIAATVGGFTASGAYAGTYPASPTFIAAANADTLLLAANANRRLAIISNLSTTALLVLLSTTVAAANNFSFVVGSGQTLELPVPVYTGQIRGFWNGAAPTAGAGVTEVT
jgi:hypothetical protein